MARGLRAAGFAVAATLVSLTMLGQHVNADNPPAATTTAAKLSPCAQFAGTSFQMGKRKIEPQINYPASEVLDLGEGWVQLEYVVTKEGIPTNFRVRDAIGAARYGEQAIEGFRAALYEPARVNGEPADVNVLGEVEFRIEGDNRAGVHTSVSDPYDESRRLRLQGKYAEALEKLREAQGHPLNLYEAASNAYGMAAAYKGLNDRHRALREIRHATIGGGQYADRGLRRAAFETWVELEVLNNNFVSAVCAFEQYMRLEPRRDADPATLALANKAIDQLNATTPVHTEAEIVETERADIPPRWEHDLARPVIKLKRLSGRLTKLRLVCPTTDVLEKPVDDEFTVELRGEKVTTCVLTVFGDPGSKLVLEEHD